MCGLIAVLTDSTLNRHDIRSSLERLRRRGPDGEGLWQEGGVTLGHRRLAILDLDERAAQPMHSACGRYVIVFNGEIYNFRDLRRELEEDGATFTTTSDTEVLLALFALHGEAMLPRLRGMFAFVIWDRDAKRAFAARDPYGIKPLYVGQCSDGVVLASQVKVILATGKVSRAPSPRGEAGFWLLGSVPEPYTWYRDIRAIPAGSAAWIQYGRVVRERRWHDIGDAWRDGEGATVRGYHVGEAVRQALVESVRRHLVADVPVGVFLSGGIDSGALAGLMVDHAASDLIGVTIAYDEFRNSNQDESPVAARIASHYGLRHHVRRVTREEFEGDLPRILDAMDQPSIDGVNTWYASKAVAELGLKVVVSGVGGDELFQGYSHFRSLPKMLRTRQTFRWLPGLDFGLAAAGRLQARRTGNLRWGHLAGWTRSIEGAWWLRRCVHAPEDLVDLMDPDLAEEALHGFDPVSAVNAMTGALAADPILAIGQIESMVYLRNQLLRDSDWASMDHGVELRTPLVDANLLGTVRPLLAAFHRFSGKTLLAQAPARPLPTEVLRRPKTGFGIPIARWLADARTSGIGMQGWMHRVAQAQELRFA
jgi:asparagine synthase (glutamine-hydrolysing)